MSSFIPSRRKRSWLKPSRRLSWLTERQHRTPTPSALATDMSLQLARRTRVRRIRVPREDCFVSHPLHNRSETNPDNSSMSMLKETGDESEAQTPQRTQHSFTSCQSDKQVGFAVVEGLSTNNKDRSRRCVQSASGSALLRDQPVTSCATSWTEL